MLSVHMPLLFLSKDACDCGSISRRYVIVIVRVSCLVELADNLVRWTDAMAWLLYGGQLGMLGPVAAISKSFPALAV